LAQQPYLQEPWKGLLFLPVLISELVLQFSLVLVFLLP
jgi:hypothetical protein